MLYVVELTYIRPIDEVKVHLDSHKDWLIANVREGSVLAAGPLEPATGGIVIASVDDATELHSMMAQDSFIKNSVAEYRVLAFEPGLIAAKFPLEWAPKAKVI